MNDTTKHQLRLFELLDSVVAKTSIQGSLVAGITKESLSNIEHQIGVVLPRSYKDFVSREQFLLPHGWSLCGLNGADSLKKKRAILQEAIGADHEKFLIFGSWGGDDDLLIFDLENSSTEDAEYPVLVSPAEGLVDLCSMAPFSKDFPHLILADLSAFLRSSLTLHKQLLNKLDGIVIEFSD